MIKLTNTSSQEIAATIGIAVAPGGAEYVAPETWDAMSSEPYIAGQVKRGRLVVERMPEPSAEGEPLTRTALAKMKRAELIEVLDAHGVTEADIEGKLVDEVRELAAEVVFAEL